MAFVGSKTFTLNNGILTIRSAQAIDTWGFLSLMRQIGDETDFLAREADELRMSPEEELRFIEDKLRHPKEILLAAFFDGILVGSLGFNSSSLHRYAHKGSFGISVLKDYWGMGIGKKLIETMLEWADANGIVKISLEVDTLNSRAIHLYKAMGFVEEGCFKMDRRMRNGEFRDSLSMARFNTYYLSIG